MRGLCYYAKLRLTSQEIEVCSAAGSRGLRHGSGVGHLWVVITVGWHHSRSHWKAGGQQVTQALTLNRPQNSGTTSIKLSKGSTLSDPRTSHFLKGPASPNTALQTKPVTHKPWRTNHSQTAAAPSLQRLQAAL